MILGAMRLYPGSLHFLGWTIPPFLKITDRQLFMLDGLERNNLRGVIPDDSITFNSEGPWEHVRQMDALFRKVDEFSPEWVVYPDSDEILPVSLFPYVLHRCKQEGLKGVSFNYAVPFGGFDYQVEPASVPTTSHLKALLWKPGLTFDGTPGFCVPLGYWGEDLHCIQPLLHLYYMTEQSREERRKRGKAEPFDAKPTLVRAPACWAFDYGQNPSASAILPINSCNSGL